MKPLSEFHKNRRKPDGREPSCKECKNAANAKYRSPEKSRMRLYGLDGINFQLLWDTQEGRCGICDDPLEHTKHGMHVDHSHETGEVRGLLCHRCNTGLGLFRDNPAYLQAAINYLG